MEKDDHTVSRGRPYGPEGKEKGGERETTERWTRVQKSTVEMRLLRVYTDGENDKRTRSLVTWVDGRPEEVKLKGYNQE